MDYGFWLENWEGTQTDELKKIIDSRIKEERETRKDRVFKAFSDFAAENRAGERLNCLFSKLWIMEDVDAVNKELCEFFKAEREKLEQTGKQYWSVIDGNLKLMAFYLCFGKNGTIKKNLLTEETQKEFLAYLWRLTVDTNDIHLSKESSWLINSSENHDIGHKASCLLSSMIFKEEEDYKDRIYPDRGEGFHFEALSPLSDKKEKYIFEELNAKDHYDAWVLFFEDYFTERAKKGFFIERASDTYMKWTLSTILGIHYFVADPQLKETAKKFLDLIWVDWAMESINGIRGGIKTRHHYSAGEHDGKDSMYNMAVFLFGGEGMVNLSYKMVMLGDYELPYIVWMMALDRKGMGKYTYLSRGLGEENPVIPRPAGMDYTMMADVEHRVVRVSYVTPQYILATPHEHPRILYNHLSVSGRWMGAILGSTKRARIVPVSLYLSPRLNNYDATYSMDITCRGVQHENVSIFQQSRRFNQGGPNMFPVYDDQIHNEMGIFIGDGWDEKVFKDKVLFLKKGNVYAAIRVILLKTDEDALAWAKGNAVYANQIVLEEEPFVWKNDALIALKSRYSPVILEMGDSDDFNSFEEFIEKILSNPPTLLTTVVQREAGVIIKYKGLGKNAKELMYNAANMDEVPLIGGEKIDYSYGMSFDSPYMKSKYNSGEINLSFRDEKLALIFKEGTK